MNNPLHNTIVQDSIKEIGDYNSYQFKRDMLLN